MSHYFVLFIIDSEGGAEFDLMSNISQGLLFHSSLANNTELDPNQLVLQEVASDHDLLSRCSKSSSKLKNIINRYLF